jgi:hypothetical protein
LKTSYTKFTPAIRGLFVAIAVLTCIWDMMLFGTALYHHVMVEKFLGGSIALLTWFLTYRCWFSTSTLPGQCGLFNYKDCKPYKEAPLNKRASINRLLILLLFKDRFNICLKKADGVNLFVSFWYQIDIFCTCQINID